MIIQYFWDYSGSACMYFWYCIDVPVMPQTLQGFTSPALELELELACTYNLEYIHTYTVQYILSSSTIVKKKTSMLLMCNSGQRFVFQVFFVVHYIRSHRLPFPGVHDHRQLASSYQLHTIVTYYSYYGRNKRTISQFYLNRTFWLKLPIYRSCPYIFLILILWVQFFGVA